MQKERSDFVLDNNCLKARKALVQKQNACKPWERHWTKVSKVQLLVFRIAVFLNHSRFQRFFLLFHSFLFFGN